MSKNAQAVLAELEATLAAAEEIIANSSGEDPGMIESLRERCVVAREKLAGYYVTARDTLVAGAQSADDTIRDNPYRSLAVAAGVGVVLGFFLNRHRSHDHE
ncbi:MAG: hypothetical protein JWM35_2275 [Verrucomicrobia bacterium]|nr:hypothetical protein [Verrucomicrobiota bacterium]